MKIKGSQILRNSNPTNQFIESKDKKQITYYLDLDGTLAEYNRWGSIGEIGNPIPSMKKRVLYWIEIGIKIKIFTARAYKKEAIPHIRKWLLLNGFPPDLEITNIKGIDCDIILDDRAREVIHNSGIICDRIGEFAISNFKDKK